MLQYLQNTKQGIHEIEHETGTQFDRRLCMVYPPTNKCQLCITNLSYDEAKYPKLHQRAVQLKA